MSGQMKELESRYLPFPPGLEYSSCICAHFSGDKLHTVYPIAQRGHSFRGVMEAEELHATKVKKYISENMRSICGMAE